MKHRIFILAAVMALATGNAFAQYNETNNLFYMVRRAPQNNLYNPAFFPAETGFYLTLPSADVHFGSPLSFHDVIHYDPAQDITVVDLNHIMHTLSDENRFRIGSEIGLLGFGPMHIIGTETAVVIGMVYDYLPYMILPIYSVMAKMDEKLIEAARDLGCDGVGVLRRVIWPLSLPGVFSGITMVLVPSISTFYISQKLGNGKFYLIGDAIEGQYAANNLHFAAAIAFILMVILLVCMAFMQRAANRRSAV